MNSALTLTKTLCLASALAFSGFAAAQNNTQNVDSTQQSQTAEGPLDQLGFLSAQFKDIAAIYNSIEDENEKKMFLGTIDQVRKDLYEFEERARRVYYSIPETEPDRNEKRSLKRKLNKLDDLLEDMMEKVKTFEQTTGKSSFYASKSIELADAYRSIAIIYALDNLENFKEKGIEWPGQKIKKLFAISIKEINTARQAITEFQLSLDE